MKLISENIPLSDLKKIAKSRFGNLVKAVVDIEKEIMVIDAELHADEEAFLLDKGSLQKNLWGINVYPDLPSPDWIEFDSMINVRPSIGNLTRNISNPETKMKIKSIVEKLISK